MAAFHAKQSCSPLDVQCSGGGMGAGVGVGGITLINHMLTSNEHRKHFFSPHHVYQSRFLCARVHACVCVCEGLILSPRAVNTGPADVFGKPSEPR